MSSSASFMGNSDGLVTVPPPPPPPPPVPGQVPAMRINTVEPPTIKRPQIVSNDGYEPPAAIQNAMLTKDKKPFTYTPGMGGKLDLSQIRSPRMARRVAKNANDEGIEGPPKSALEPKPTPPANAGANLFVQPQVAVPVFPTNLPVQTSANKTPPTPTTTRVPPPIAVEPPKPTNKVETKVAPITVIPVQPGTPESPSTPTQVTLSKAPTPWMQNKNKPPEEKPEWAKRASVTKQTPSPDSSTSPPVFIPVQPPTPQPAQWQPPAQQKFQAVQQRQQPQQFQYPQQAQQFQPQQQQQPQQFQQQQKRPYTSPPTSQQTSPQQERVVPIRIEDRPSVFDAKPEAGHHQFKQSSTPHHQQRWGQPQAQNQATVQQPVQQPLQQAQHQQTSGGSYIIPIMVEGTEKRTNNGPPPTASYSQPPVRNNVVDSQTPKVVQQRGQMQAQPVEQGPVQSRSFRVLQKITDTDVQNDVDPEQIRKLQLTEDDRILMNKFKEQVDNESYLHHEEDPRYRGAAIPSRAFRFLQTMTDSGESPVPSTTPRVQSAINKKQNRNSKSFEETQGNLPPSEQQVQEPKKYMGSAIPSRSFRILQAMTAPESVATQENRQADYTCQTENNVPGNQQGTFYPPCPPPFWNPEGGWWGYYPLSYPNVSNDHVAPFDPYSCHADGTAYVYYPIYNQNYPPYPQYGHDPLNGKKNDYLAVYPPYVLPTNPPNVENKLNPPYGQSNVKQNVSNDDATIGVSENRLQKRGGSVSNENNFNSLSQWDRGNTSRTASSSSNKDSDCTTAMNITDEEEIPETVVVNGSNGKIEEPIEVEMKSCPSAGLNVNVPNYTYIDTSDSSDSSDTESHTDNESIIESTKSNDSNDSSDNTSSDSDDSDSYLAYSTGLNPHGRFQKDVERKSCSGKESCDDRNETDFDKVNYTDCESDSEDQTERDVERSKTDSTFPHQLSVIYEDVEQVENDSPRPQDSKDHRKWKEGPLETTDDPPDEMDTTTVSVSLPLRFKFSVSENNEDVTTVIVGDSTIKPQRPCEKEEARCSKVPEYKGHEKTSEVSVNYQVNNETSVDFTVKRQSNESKRKTRNHLSDRTREDSVESKIEKFEKMEKIEEVVTPHVNFTLRKNPSRLGRINCEETIQTEFTIKPRKSVRKEETKVEKEQSIGPGSREVSKEVNKKTASVDTLIENVNYDATVKVEQTIFGTNAKTNTHDVNKNVVKPEVVVSECAWEDESSKVRSNDFVDTTKERKEVYQENISNLSRKIENEEDRNTDVEDKAKGPKHLLNVQNSREETDDEDSGVTSDMSRIISEVDTDSECTSSKNIRKYQRTQTHSRLFRLLNDDSILPEDTEKNTESCSRREYLSLPLKNNAFNYDENYCSNYSSGLTSPEYSPVCEKSWKRLHDTESSPSTVLSTPRTDKNVDILRQYPLTSQERLLNKEDPYYQAWKAPKSSSTTNDHDVLPSLAFKILESRRPLWAYKVNVLCPRIKSTKNVPQTLQTNDRTNNRINDSLTTLPQPLPVSSHNSLKKDHC